MRLQRILPAAALLVASLPAFGAAFDKRSGQGFRVAAGETIRGDRYVLSAMTIAIDGTLDGDLVGWSRTIAVKGAVTGDAILAAEAISVDGIVGDSMRLAANTVTINGTIDGDLLAFAASVVVGPNANIKGDLIVFAQIVSVSGIVAGNIRMTGGEFALIGSVAGNVSATGEEVSLGPMAKIGGDFSYESRDEIDVPAGSVTGTVRYEPVRDDKDEEKKESSPVKSVLWWIWKSSAALVVGFILLAAFHRAGPRIADTVGRDTLGSLGVGFVTAVVIPVASVLICVLVITIPLAVLAVFLYFVVLYVAKLPVAAWLGQRVLRWMGAKAPGVWAGLSIGVPLLYLLFEVPYLGTLIWFVALFVGLGAMLVGSRSARGARPSESAPAEATPPLPAAT